MIKVTEFASPLSVSAENWRSCTKAAAATSFSAALGLWIVCDALASIDCEFLLLLLGWGTNSQTSQYCTPSQIVVLRRLWRRGNRNRLFCLTNRHSDKR